MISHTFLCRFINQAKVNMIHRLAIKNVRDFFPFVDYKLNSILVSWTRLHIMDSFSSDSHARNALTTWLVVRWQFQTTFPDCVSLIPKLIPTPVVFNKISQFSKLLPANSKQILLLKADFNVVWTRTEIRFQPLSQSLDSTHINISSKQFMQLHRWKVQQNFCQFMSQLPRRTRIEVLWD